MNIKNLKLADLHPYARNPRKNDGAVDAVAPPHLKGMAGYFLLKKFLNNIGKTLSS